MIQFRKELEKLGVLFWEYDTTLQFERNVREHLIRQVFNLAEPEKTISDTPPSSPPSRGVKPSPKKRAKEELFTPTSSKPRKLNVFMAYVHEDREKVTNIYHNLRSADMNPWLDSQNLLPGQMWHKEVNEALKSSDIVLVFISKHSVSNKGFFQKEIKSAIEIVRTQKTDISYVVPVRLDNVEVPTDLAVYSWINYFQPYASKKLLDILKELSKSLLAEPKHSPDGEK